MVVTHCSKRGLLTDPLSSPRPENRRNVRRDQSDEELTSDGKILAAALWKVGLRLGVMEMEDEKGLNEQEGL